MKKQSFSAISKEIKKQGHPDWILDNFNRVRNNPMIRRLLDRAYLETAQRDFKNRHGVAHGLSTAYNAVRLFDLVNRDLVSSDYMEILELNKEEVLITLMIAGLIHDTGRFYDNAIKNHEEQVNDAISVLEKLLQFEILTESGRLKGDEMIKRVKELCLCHDKKDQPSGKVEIALMKLADALDVGPHRVYSKEDKKALDCCDEERLMLIFRKDKHPGRYFGPKSLSGVSIEWNKREEIIEITFKLKDYACAEEIKKTLNILDKTKSNGHDPVKNLAKRIFVYIETPESKRYRLYPSKKEYAEFRSEAARIPQARISNVEFRFNILNMNGDTDVELPLEIKNVDNEAGVESQTAILGGDFPSKWNDIGLTWVEQTKSGLRALPQPEYLYLDEDGLNHHYRIKFGRKVGVGETISLKGNCRWNHFVNVESSEMRHSVATPTDRIKINIRLPKDLDYSKFTAYQEVSNIAGDTLLRAPMQPKKHRGRLAIVWEITGLKRQHGYKVAWSAGRGSEP